MMKLLLKVLALLPLLTLITARWISPKDKASTPQSFNPQAGEEMLEQLRNPTDSDEVTILDVTGKSGMVVINQTSGSSMFYWQIDKLGTTIDTDDSPLILWLEGGPGCSSEIANFFELGPLYIDDNLQPQRRYGSWSEDYHILFIDNPYGAGYSFAANPSELIKNFKEFEENLYYMLLQLAQKYPSWFKSSRPLYIFGESYGGTWVPLISYRILNENSNATTTGNTVFPLKGIGIGNGWSDPINQISKYSHYGYSLGLFDENQRSSLMDYEQSCVVNMELQQWEEAFSDWWDYILPLSVNYTGKTGSSTSSGINIYNYRMYHEYDYGNYPDWLNLDSTKTLLHAPSSVHYTDCNFDIFYMLNSSVMQSVAYTYPTIFQHIPVIQYEGQDDFIVNYENSENWITKLKWSGHDGFNNAEKYPWKVDGKVVGYWREYENLTRVVILKAGHMVAHEQLNVTRLMANKFIGG